MNAPRKVIVSVRNVYGNTVVYPVCPDAERFAAIAGTKTLSAQVLAQIAALGFEVGYGGDTKRMIEVIGAVARITQGAARSVTGVA